ncbi:hypothetical protein FB464_1131 [Subtercola boreus]|nr:hypothetical protein FB464_1131 [Subtercola boreus]
MVQLVLAASLVAAMTATLLAERRPAPAPASSGHPSGLVQKSETLAAGRAGTAA